MRFPIAGCCGLRGRAHIPLGIAALWSGPTPARPAGCHKRAARLFALLVAVAAACARGAAEQAVPSTPATLGVRSKPEPAPPAQPPALGLALRWSTALPAPPAAGLTTDGTSAYIPLRGGRLAAVNLETAALRWAVPAATSFPPAADGTRVYTVGADAVEAFGGADGAVLWRTPLGGAPATQPVVDGMRLLVALSSGDVAALDARTGERLWLQSYGAAPSAPPAVAGPRFYVGLTDGRIVAAELATGAAVWTYATDGGVTGLTVADDRMYVGSRDNFFYALSLSDGRFRWRWRTGGDVIGRPVLDEHRVYFASLDNVLRALDRRNGTQQWKRALPFRPLAGPSLVQGALVVAGLAAEVRLYDLLTGKPIAATPVPSELAAMPVLVTLPVPYGEGVVVLLGNGGLVLLGRQIEPPLSPLTELPGAERPLTADLPAPGAPPAPD